MALLCALALGSGCAATPEAKTPAAPDASTTPAVQNLQLCRTTLPQLLAELGAPTRDGLLHRQRIVSWLRATEPVVRYLAVLLDEREVVVDVYWNVPTEIPWQPQSQCR